MYQSHAEEGEKASEIVSICFLSQPEHFLFCTFSLR